VLVLAGALAYRLLEDRLFKLAMVPTVEFDPANARGGADYRQASAWIARPGLRNDPSAWLPTGFRTEPGSRPAAVFFIHPTSFLDRSEWNAPLDHQESQWRARLFVQHQASAFAGVGEVWAPKYRQATFGAFLTTKADANKALDFAYRDVLAAFDRFLDEVPAGRPLILAAHSQGSLHLTRLLRERVAAKPIARRIVAAYVVGWPVSTTADLPLLGLPACEQAGQAGCILSWQSFGEPADPKLITDVYDASIAPNGQRRAGSPMLCVNPLTGNAGDAADAKANLGTLFPNDELTQADIRANAVPARCGVNGFLLIGRQLPEFPPYVLPGNNYHVFDYALFWANIRADAAARLRTFLSR
jgi:hypothetical protein